MHPILMSTNLILLGAAALFVIGLFVGNRLLNKHVQDFKSKHPTVYIELLLLLGTLLVSISMWIGLRWLVASNNYFDDGFNYPMATSFYVRASKLPGILQLIVTNPIGVMFLFTINFLLVQLIFFARNKVKAGIKFTNNVRNVILATCFLLLLTLSGVLSKTASIYSNIISSCIGGSGPANSCAMHTSSVLELLLAAVWISLTICFVAWLILAIPENIKRNNKFPIAVLVTLIIASIGLTAYILHSSFYGGWPVPSGDSDQGECKLNLNGVLECPKLPNSGK
jgi:putative flippase GtrA